MNSPGFFERKISSCKLVVSANFFSISSTREESFSYSGHWFTLTLVQPQVLWLPEFCDDARPSAG
jgi:hypothetical protein